VQAKRECESESDNEDTQGDGATVGPQVGKRLANRVSMLPDPRTTGIRFTPSCGETLGVSHVKPLPDGHDLSGRQRNSPMTFTADQFNIMSRNQNCHPNIVELSK
jgi:hypothetical protein